MSAVVPHAAIGALKRASTAHLTRGDLCGIQAGAVGLLFVSVQRACLVADGVCCCRVIARHGEFSTRSVAQPVERWWNDGAEDTCLT